MRRIQVCSILLALSTTLAFGQSEEQLAKWLKRFPAADTNKDGKLTLQEAKAFRKKVQQGRAKAPAGQQRRGGTPRTFKVDPGWDKDKFPDHAVCYRSPQEIAKIYGGQVISKPKPTDGSLRIVGTGHSFMVPGYETFPAITAAAGFKQMALHTHTSGGVTGSARYKWEQENGIFQFDKKPTPKLLASIANGEWDAMMWGPYRQDKAEYYECWIDFCLKYNPDMTFYLSDAWPSFTQLDEVPKSEAELTPALYNRLHQEKVDAYKKVFDSLVEKYPNKVFIIPTSKAMTLAVEYFHRGELPGIEGIHKIVGKKERSLWRDHLGHLGPGLGNLEGYVFYATLYRKRPAEIKGDVFAGQAFPSNDLDRAFRKIAWEAVLQDPRSGVTAAAE